jgi:hypothetical protein
LLTDLHRLHCHNIGRIHYEQVHILARANSDLSALPAAHTYTAHVGDVTDAASLRRACERASSVPPATASSASTSAASKEPPASASASESSSHVVNQPRRTIAAVFHLAAHIGYTRAERAKMQVLLGIAIHTRGVF